MCVCAFRFFAEIPNSHFVFFFWSATTLPYKDGIPEMLDALLPIATCQVIGVPKDGRALPCQRAVEALRR